MSDMTLTKYKNGIVFDVFKFMKGLITKISSNKIQVYQSNLNRIAMRVCLVKVKCINLTSQ